MVTEMSMTMQEHDMHDQQTTNSVNCQPAALKTDMGISSYPG